MLLILEELIRMQLNPSADLTNKHSRTGQEAIKLCSAHSEMLILSIPSCLAEKRKVDADTGWCGSHHTSSSCRLSRAGEQSQAPRVAAPYLLTPSGYGMQKRRPGPWWVERMRETTPARSPSHLRRPRLSRFRGAARQRWRHGTPGFRCERRPWWGGGR
jgi:hypothetical protein